MRRVKVHAAGVFRVSILIHSSSAIFVGEEFLDFPVALFRPNTKFQIFFGNRVPVLYAKFSTSVKEISNPSHLIHHHHSQKIANRGEEQSV